MGYLRKSKLSDLNYVCQNMRQMDRLEGLYQTGRDPEEALRHANSKFTRRFRFIEAELKKRGKSPEQSDLDEMDALWNAAKAQEKSKA